MVYLRMKQYILPCGRTIKVDDEDFWRLEKYTWRSYFDGWNYYVRRSSTINKKAKTFLLHREVLGITDRSVYIDHIDHDGLNNQKNNLRKCTPSENKKNVRGRGSSKYLGVDYHKSSKGWQARIQHNKKQIYLGIYPTEEAAAKAYDEAAKKFHGEFANLNFK